MNKDNYLEQFKSYYSQQDYNVLQNKRNEIFKLADNVFRNHLERIDLTLSEITVISCDQGGWPFQALYMKIGTGHSTLKFYEMVLAVLQIMYE